jgi:CRISPR/Cas system-associated exonuclease Cas4 (RecB family)
MKITLNELRQMVRNVLSEMDEKQYRASSNDNYMTVTQTDVDDEEYEINNDKSRLQEVINLVAEKANFIVTNCISFSSVKDYEYEYTKTERMNDVKEGRFNDNGNYEYFILEEDNGEQRILVIYNTDGYGEDFIFEGYLDEEDGEDEYRDEYPRNWTNPEEL